MALTPKQKRVVKNNLIGYSFILPNFIGYFLFIFIPVVFSFVLSVMKWNGSANTPMEFVGFDNFVRLMEILPLRCPWDTPFIMRFSPCR